ncbi:nuclear transport factor 2 family protein [Haloarcula sp. JP-L23]|uniref:nuclear transport factor 2 family protein n=1 Tax=Haloarcula sp. JP-L23 TaxID=2716717 RepID=UPI00140EE716|nr:nuclear transport factor 2 family protein [Haloarcula sp. JP-L23]
MASTEETFTRAHIEDVLRAFETGDVAAAAEFWADDGVFIDPHYPEPEYRGPDAVREALEWALETIVEQPGLTVRHVWEADDTFAVEVDTHHTMKDGSEADFRQVFVVETEDGEITRWQSYLPFPPSAEA